MKTSDIWRALERLVDGPREPDEDAGQRTARCLDLMETLICAGELDRLVERYRATPSLEAQRVLTFHMARAADTHPAGLRAHLLAVIGGLPGDDATALTNLSTTAHRLAITDQWRDADDSALDGLARLIRRALDSGTMPATAALDLLGRLVEDGVFARMSQGAQGAITRRVDALRDGDDPLIELSLETLTLPGAEPRPVDPDRAD